MPPNLLWETRLWAVPSANRFAMMGEQTGNRRNRWPEASTRSFSSAISGAIPKSGTPMTGNPIVNLSVATSEQWRDRNSGERRERTEWHRVVIFNERLGEFAQKYLHKGRKVYVEGQLQTRKWTGQDGQERYTTEVVLQRFRGELTMLDSRGDGRRRVRFAGRRAGR